jgi:titin
MSITLTWTDSVSPGITGHTVLWRSSTTSTWTEFTPGTLDTTGTVVTGLTNGTTYNLKVTTTSTFGNTDSSQVIATPQAVPGVPTLADPANPTLQKLNSTSLILYWATPAGAKPTYYNVWRNGSKLNTTPITATQLSIQNLTSMTEYSFEVEACNATACSAKSNTYKVTTPPGFPSNLVVTPSAYAARVAWRDSLNAESHKIEYRVKNTAGVWSAWQDAPNAVPHTSPTDLTNLTGGAYYEFRVGAWGAGAVSYITTTTPVVIWGPPAQMAQPTVSRPRGEEQNALAVTWIAPFDGGASITSYKTYVNGTLVQESAGTAGGYTIRGLNPGTKYVVTIEACNRVACSPSSVGLDAFTTPPAPTSLAATTYPLAADISWTDATAPAISGYKVFYRKAGVTQWSSPVDGASGVTISGLAAVTTYEYKVASWNPGGLTESPVSTFKTLAYQPPTIPLSVTATPGLNKLTFSWEKPEYDGDSAITDYEFQLTTDGGTPVEYGVGTISTARTLEITGLLPTSSYVLEVRAKNTAGISQWSAPSTASSPYTLPGTPTNVVGVAGDSKVTLTWDAPGGDGGTPLTDYFIKISSNNGSTWTTPTGDVVSTSTTAEITGLTNGTRYVFKVAAKNAAGEGSYSTPSQGVVSRTVPTAPKNPVGQVGDTQVTLSWGTPSSNGGAVVTDYDVEYSSDGGSTWDKFPHQESQAFQQVVTSLVNGTSYIFRVAAINIVGTGPWSDPSPAYVPRGAPAAPTAVIGTVGDRFVELSWTPNGSTNGSAVTDYLVQFSTNNGAPSWQTFNETAPSPLPTTRVTGLVNGTAYIFRVAAVNGAGAGSYSTVSSPYTPSTVPATPTAVRSTPADSQALVSWTAPGSTGGSVITDYVVQYSSDGGVNWVTFSRVGASTALAATVTSLTNGTTYVFRVAAVNSAGTGGWSMASAPMILRLPPDAPTELTATPGNATIALTWEAPAFDGGSAITDYIIETSTNGTNWIVVPSSQRTTTSATSATVTGLQNATSYSVRVSAKNAAGTGSPVVTGPVTPFTVPAATTRPTGTPGNTQVSLSWSTPSSNGGAVITDYVIEHSSNAGATWTTFDDGISTDTTRTITGLTNGTAYLFRVSSKNAAGSSPTSPASLAITPRTVPGMPTALQGTPGIGSITLAWTAPLDNGGNAISDYVILISSNGGTTFTPHPHTKSATTGIVVSGLLNGTEYFFKVAARNDAGDSLPTDAIGPISPRTAPSMPLKLTGAYGNSQVVLTWDPPSSDGGDQITDYVVQWALSSAATTWFTFNDGTSALTTATVTNLVNGTSYIFKVAAKNGAGTGAFSSQTPAVVPKTNPSAPSFIATEGMNASVKVMWGVTSPTGGAALTDYIVQYSSDAGVTWTTFPDGLVPDTKLTSTVVTGLTNGTAYLFRVAATNVVPGFGDWVTTVDPTTPSTVSSSPFNLTATAQRESADLTWTAPGNNGGAAIRTYRVEHSTNNGLTWQTFGRAESLTTSVTVPNLAAGIPVIFRVAATNANGDSPNATNPISAAVIPFGNPGTPGTPAITACGDEQLTLSWTAPLNSGGKPVSDYEIQISKDGAPFSSYIDGTSAATTATLIGLSNGSSYTARILTITEAGSSGYSTPSAACTPSGLPTPPGEPQPTAGDKKATITWAASDANGSAITSYIVQFSFDFGKNWSLVSGTGTGLSAVISNLTNGIPYVFRVAGKNANGEGDWSPLSAIATPFGLPFAPAMNPPVAGDAEVAISWTAAANNGSVVTDYEVQYSMNNGPWTDFTTSTTDPSLATTVTGLTNSKSYTFRVRAINAAGPGAWAIKSAVSIPRTKPDAPTAVTGVRGNTLVTLTWDAPADDGGAAINDYIIEWSSDGGTVWSIFSDGVNVARNLGVSSLINGTPYVFRVAAKNVAGQGPWSEIVGPVTPGTTPNTTTAVVCAAGNKEALISWTAPSSNGGYAITDYLIKWSKDAGSTWSDFADGISDNNSANMTNLTNGTTYVFKIAAVNDVGTGTWSTVSAGCRPVYSPDAPDAPTVTKSGDFEVTLTWNEPFDNGHPTTDYVIHQSTNDGTTWTTLTDGESTATTLVLPNLSQVLVYRWRVAGKNSIGVGTPSGWSDPVSFATVPDKPTGLFGTFGDTQVQLGWTGPFNGGAAITSYIVELSTDGGSTWAPTVNFQWDGTSTSTNITGLTNGTTYKIRIAAVNVVGPSPWSDASAEFIPMRVPTLPSSVGCSPGDATATIGWSALDPDGGGVILDYVVQYSSDNGATWTAASEGISGAKSASITGLTNGTTYRFRVAGKNAAGQGAWSIASSSCLVRATPSAPALTTISSTASSATFGFTGPASNGGASISGYTVACVSSNGGTTRYGTGAASPVAVSNLDAGKNYSCSITAANAAGSGPASNSSSLSAVQGTRTDYACNAGDSPSVVSSSPFECTRPASNPVSTRYRPGATRDESGTTLSWPIMSTGQYYCASSVSYSSATWMSSRTYPYKVTTATDPYGCKSTVEHRKDNTSGKCWSDPAYASSMSNSKQGTCNTTVFKHVFREADTKKGDFSCGHDGDPWSFSGFLAHQKSGTRADAWCWRSLDENDNLRSWDWANPESYYTSGSSLVTYWSGWNAVVNIPPAPVASDSVSPASEQIVPAAHTQTAAIAYLPNRKR